MKKIWMFILAILILIPTSIKVSAETDTTNDIVYAEFDINTWHYVETTNEIILSSYSGQEPNLYIPGTFNNKQIKISSEGTIFHRNLEHLKIGDISQKAKLAAGNGKPFSQLPNVVSMDLTGLDVSNIANFSSMFAENEKLETLNLDGWNTQNATHMHHMFIKCKSLKNLNISSFNTSNVTYMVSMFSQCESLTELDLFNFDTRKVTNMAAMFWGCFNLESVNVTSFNTSNVTNIFDLFSGCKKLSNVDLSGFDMRNVNDMRYMFNNCVNLNPLDLSSFQLKNSVNMQDMFHADSPTRLLIISTDEKIKSYNYQQDNRVPYTLNIHTDLDNYGLAFNDGSTDKAAFNKYVVSSLDETIIDQDKLNGHYQNVDLQDRFLGWSLMPNGTPINQPLDLVLLNQSEINVYALWSNQAKYTVNHYQQNLAGTGYTLMQSEEFYDVINTEATVVDKQYTGFTIVPNEASIILADGSLVITQRYDRNQFTVNFNTNGGSEIESINGFFGNLITLPAEPLKLGYTFEGWYKDNNFAQLWNEQTDVLSQSLTLFAKWKEVIIPPVIPPVPTPPVTPPVAPEIKPEIKPDLTAPETVPNTKAESNENVVQTGDDTKSIQLVVLGISALCGMLILIKGKRVI